MQLDSLPFKEALLKALDATFIKQETKIVMIDDALGKVVAEDLFVQKNLPSFDNSAMDGYAFKAKDAGKQLKVQKSIFAGQKAKATLKEGECYKIMTGAQVPCDADTIAPFEKCSDISDEMVTLPKEIKKGANLRLKGEETRVGELLFTKGTLLGYAEIALLAAQGITALKVFLPLKVAVVSSGNEIREPWEEASEDEIYNANAFGITSLLRFFGFDASYVGSIPDDLGSTISFLADIKSYDVILTTGGISHGDADYLYRAFIANGMKPLFHGIAVKPGHPTMMGIMDDTFVMGMPGNPLTTMVMTHALSLPLLFKMQGNNKVHHNYTLAKMAQSLNFRAKRTHIVIGSVEDGIFYPTNGGKVGSGMLKPLAQSSAFAYFDATKESVEEGELLKVVMMHDQTRSKTFELLNK
ncbi:Molybdopterin biosynthesis protein MoeA [hydrothermal vent metagenome]|uniref:Molybdopterin biosynthesis protein MoeA n=1 Tax=hydrothermal vent metagenome TaxID=652676 RepID=A0A1W1C1Z8_9ZZZZ